MIYFWYVSGMLLNSYYSEYLHSHRMGCSLKELSTAILSQLATIVASENMEVT
jgi:hypothetical protein